MHCKTRKEKIGKFLVGEKHSATERGREKGEDETPVWSSFFSFLCQGDPLNPDDLGLTNGIEPRQPEAA